MIRQSSIAYGLWALLVFFSNSAHPQKRDFTCGDDFSTLTIDPCDSVAKALEAEYGMTPRDYVSLMTNDIRFDDYLDLYRVTYQLINEELKNEEPDDEWLLFNYFRIFPLDRDPVLGKGITQGEYLVMLKSNPLFLLRPMDLEPKSSLLCKLRKSVLESKGEIRTHEELNRAPFSTPMMDLGLNILFEGFEFENRGANEQHSIYRPIESVYINEHSFGLDMRSVHRLLFKGNQDLKPWLDPRLAPYVENKHAIERSEKIDILSTLHSAMWQLAKFQAVRDLSALPKVTDQLTLADVFFWTTIYFNAGEENAKVRLKTLKWNVPKHYPCELSGNSYEWLTTDARCHATWRTASFELAYAKLHACERPRQRRFKDYATEEDKHWP